ncbi:MAG: hypothetical protein ABIG46_01720 [Candidatus Omnitrophota bacterium]|nr:hypothetical protein [Candidatus Omnitrophota bacterium]
MIKNQRGVSLIELVTIIVVLGIAIPVLLNMWAVVAERSVRTESMAEAGLYAEELMEIIKSKSFDENATTPWSALGRDTGESAGNSALYDDVDDFIGCTDPAITTPAAGYSRSASISYMSLTGGTWGTIAGPTDFKRIVVTVSRTDNLVNNVNLTTIVSGF